MERTLARACALACFLGGSLSALPSDELLDSLKTAAGEHQAAGRISERDQAEALLELLARQRVVADSTPAVPKRCLAELDKHRSERAKREAKEDASARRPPPEVERILKTASDSTTSASSAPAVAENPSPAAPAPVSRRSTCPGGPIRFHWLQPSIAMGGQTANGAARVRIRLDAPCGLSRIELYVDDQSPRNLLPRTGVGSFEFSDSLHLGEGVHRAEALACDTTYQCARSLPTEIRISGSVPPWVPRAIGVLVGICGVLGLSLFLHRHPHAHRSALPVGRSAVTVPESKGLSGTLRKRLQMVAQEIGPAFPSVSLRLPERIAALAIDPESLGDAFTTLLHLHARRAATGGQILIAMGQGPVSAEVVFEDTADSPDDDALHALLDPSRPRVRERMGLDRELEVAVRSFQRAGGSVSAEVRIDGGLRTRMKIPLSHGEAKAA